MSALVERIIAARDAAKRHRDGPLLSVMADAANVIVVQEALLKAAEARVALLEGLVEDYDTRILLAHDALEAARDKMRGAVEEDDQRVYDRVYTAIYVLRSRPSRALAAKLEGRGDG